MILDRKLQREILERLAGAYPGQTHMAWISIKKLDKKPAVISNMLYLEAHGLLKSGLKQAVSGDFNINSAELSITAKGLDFLADDGGLSAILGVVTIKIHDDQFRLLLTSSIQESNAPEEEKQKWLDQLREIPVDATKHLVHKLIDAGLAQWPSVLVAMQTLGK